MNSVNILTCQRKPFTIKYGVMPDGSRGPKHFAGPWVFDDARFNLIEEPFVCGASEAIDRAIERQGFDPDKTAQIDILFSIAPMPNSDIILRRKWPHGDMAALGCEYFDGEEEVWLCPAMRHYFCPGDGHQNGPERIYAQIRNVRLLDAAPLP